MLEQASIFLCFLTGEPSEIELALEYWGVDSQGRWKNTVREISERTGEPKHKIPEIVRRVVVTHDLDIRCADCRNPRVVSSRSDATYGVWRGLNYLCESCRSARLAAERLREAEEKQVEYERAREIIQALSDEGAVFDYSEIGYLDAVVAYGIMLSSDSAVATGLLGSPYHLPLCPSNSLLSRLLGRLFNHGILALRRDTPTDAIDPISQDNQQFSYYPLKVNWQFARPITDESFSSVFRQIGSVIDKRSDHPEFDYAVSELWWMLGMADAQRYLEQELNRYRLSGFVAGEKMKEALLYALNRFSIPRLRYLLFRIAKNTAALSSRRDFTKQHALNTIPGSLIRDCDRALADNWAIKPYCMKWDEEEARLIAILFDRVLGTGIEGLKSAAGLAFEQAVA